MHERAGVSGTLPSFASKVRAYLLDEVPWEDIHDAQLSIPQIEHSHILLIRTSGFDYLHLFVWLKVRIVVGSSIQVSRVAFCVSMSSGGRWVHAWCGRLWKDQIGSSHGAVL